MLFAAKIAVGPASPDQLRRVLDRMFSMERTGLDPGLLERTALAQRPAIAGESLAGRRHVQLAGEHRDPRMPGIDEVGDRAERPTLVVDDDRVRPSPSTCRSTCTIGTSCIIRARCLLFFLVGVTIQAVHPHRLEQREVFALALGVVVAVAQDDVVAGVLRHGLDVLRDEE